MLDVGPRGVYNLAQELAHNVTKVKNKTERKPMLGIMVKLNEAAKGNIESVRQSTLEDAFDDFVQTFLPPSHSVPCLRAKQ
jgi:hypothetical protein